MELNIIFITSSSFSTMLPESNILIIIINISTPSCTRSPTWRIICIPNSLLLPSCLRFITVSSASPIEKNILLLYPICSIRRSRLLPPATCSIIIEFVLSALINDDDNRLTIANGNNSFLIFIVLSSVVFDPIGTLTEITALTSL